MIQALLLALAASSATAFYVPGIQPHPFTRGEPVPLKVNSMTSMHTQMPRGYYRLAFCEPEEIEMASENLGEFLTGNKIQNSPYEIKMLDEVYCKKLCPMPLDKVKSAKMKMHVKYGYHHNWIIDNLPSAAIIMDKNHQQKTRYAGGFPIGFMGTNGEAYIHNHVNIHVEYHAQEGDVYSVVGFAVEPLSIKHTEKDGALTTCPTGNSHMIRDDIRENQVVKDGETIIYSYDVTWDAKPVEWTSRWDIYLNENHLVPAKVHWYSITNSILVVMFLSLLVISILVRNLKRDIAAYNALSLLADEERDEEADETGWKLVHADVFRPPQTMSMLYCVFCGSGMQLALTAFFAICFSAVGFISPARRGSLVIFLLVVYMLLGIVSGYLSSRLYKAFRGRQWQLCTILTSILFPGMAYGLFVFFNIILWIRESSASAPFLDVIILGAMWCCISIPLCFLGAYFGYREEAMEFPTVTSTIARAIPTPPPLLHPMVGMCLTGIIPFAAAYVELFFIMTSLWMDQFYYVFGFTLIVYLILIITCAEITVLLVYYQLCAENHRWWWYAFFCSGSTAFYTFVYSIFWFKTLEASRLVMTYLLYFGYMFLICFGMFLVFGMVGAMTSFWFTRKIFGTIKVD